MSFEELLKKRVIEHVTVTPREIGALLGVAKRDIHAAQEVVNLDLDWAFTIAYNAILQLSIAFMAQLGYRPRGEGKHYNTFRFMEEALPEDKAMIRRLQKLRRKRNKTLYEQAGVVSEEEALDVIAFASRYYDEIKSKLPPEVVGEEPEEESS